jgi:hypothetical protein
MTHRFGELSDHLLSSPGESFDEAKIHGVQYVILEVYALQNKKKESRRVRQYRADPPWYLEPIGSILFLFGLHHVWSPMATPHRMQRNSTQNLRERFRKFYAGPHAITGKCGLSRVVQFSRYRPNSPDLPLIDGGPGTLYSCKRFR